VACAGRPLGLLHSSWQPGRGPQPSAGQVAKVSQLKCHPRGARRSSAGSMALGAAARIVASQPKALGWGLQPCLLLPGQCHSAASQSRALPAPRGAGGGKARPSRQRSRPPAAAVVAGSCQHCCCGPWATPRCSVACPAHPVPAAVLAAADDDPPLLLPAAVLHVSPAPTTPPLQSPAVE
jgi:hypothetical protein